MTDQFRSKRRRGKAQIPPGTCKRMNISRYKRITLYHFHQESDKTKFNKSKQSCLLKRADFASLLRRSKATKAGKQPKLRRLKAEIYPPLEDHAESGATSIQYRVSSQYVTAVPQIQLCTLCTNAPRIYCSGNFKWPRIRTVSRDPRGESCLIVGQGLDYRWIHVLCGNFYDRDILIITVYIPKAPKWEDPFTRRA